MKAFPIYTDHNDLWAHLYDEHEHTPHDEHDAEADHDAMHRPASVFGDSGHIHSDSPNRCAAPGCTGVYDPNLVGTPAEWHSGVVVAYHTGWTFDEDEDDDIPAHDHTTLHLIEGGA